VVVIIPIRKLNQRICVGHLNAKRFEFTRMQYLLSSSQLYCDFVDANYGDMYYHENDNFQGQFDESAFFGFEE